MYEVGIYEHYENKWPFYGFESLRELISIFVLLYSKDK